ncbi:MAG: hypothetical protein JRN26_02885 [Nitrososphaerota archaeon]|jgi:hypothetical protein|nr:hypothetical protein [Nitrososphaerota archaeon]MDG6928288.1 hypothetical protein [Nitrososphaerota archaeon]MDG6931561.1 hypothetical protein [Nitrososphaerota archaeon]MDG6935820.1 hypothetical protein [Nitrososphaerota archaeon]MDG6943479.1 hypothetical protein [Nitrososphaerota archaeon]
MRRAVADVFGAVFLVSVIFLASTATMFTVGTYFTEKESYNSIMEIESGFSKQNLTVYYLQALPPGGSPGIAVTNYGSPTCLKDLVTESSGSLSFRPENECLQYGSTVYLYTDDPDSGILTCLGALFMANSSSTNLVPVSKVAINTTVSFPPQLEWVHAGSGPWETTSSVPVKWFVNGTYAHAGRTLTIWVIDGPTTITAVPVNSNP